jgi:hypothetical protein
MNVRIRETGICRRAHRVVQPTVPTGDAAQRVVADRNLVHDQLGSAVYAVDFPNAVAVVTDVGTSVLRAPGDFVQGKGLEHAQSDIVLDELAGLVEDLYVRFVDALRRIAEGIARNRNPDVVALVDRDRRDRV